MWPGEYPSANQPIYTIKRQVHAENFVRTDNTYITTVWSHWCWSPSRTLIGRTRDLWKWSPKAFATPFVPCTTSRAR